MTNHNEPPIHVALIERFTEARDVFPRQSFSWVQFNEAIIALEAAKTEQLVGLPDDVIKRWAKADKTVKGLPEECYLTKDGITDLCAALRDKGDAELELHKLATSGSTTRESVNSWDKIRPIHRPVTEEEKAIIKNHWDAVIKRINENPTVIVLPPKPEPYCLDCGSPRIDYRIKCNDIEDEASHDKR